jgi:hypothetical protein
MAEECRACRSCGAYSHSTDKCDNKAAAQQQQQQQKGQRKHRHQRQHRPTASSNNVQPPASPAAAFVLLPAAASEEQQQAMAAALVHALFGHEQGEYAVGLVADVPRLALLARLAPHDLAGILGSGPQQAQQLLESVWRQHSSKDVQEAQQLDDAAVNYSTSSIAAAAACADTSGGYANSTAAAIIAAAAAAAAAAGVEQPTRQPTSLPAAEAAVGDVDASVSVHSTDQQGKQLLLDVQSEHSSAASVAAVVAAVMPDGCGDADEDELEEMLSLLGV